jgi:Arginyl-tRNA synthetase
MTIESKLRSEIQNAISALFGLQAEQLQIQPTNREFEGSHTLVCFPLTKTVRKKPEEIGNAIGEHLVAHSGIVKAFNVVKGFLNLTLHDNVWVKALTDTYINPQYGLLPSTGEEIMIEYSSPNTNKPPSPWSPKE